MQGVKNFLQTVFSQKCDFNQWFKFDDRLAAALGRLSASHAVMSSRLQPTAPKIFIAVFKASSSKASENLSGF